jgi:hypothetical protein
MEKLSMIGKDDELSMQEQEEERSMDVSKGEEEQ